MTEPRKTPRSKQVAGLAATLERYAETYNACACNEADSWEAGRFLEAAKQLRAIEAETQEMAEALARISGYFHSDRINLWHLEANAAADLMQMRRFTDDALARHRAKQEVQS